MDPTHGWSRAFLLGRMSQLLAPGNRRSLFKQTLSYKRLFANIANIFVFFVSALSTWYPLWLQVIPPYNGYGFLEDSLQNCYSLFPKPPRKDVIKMLENDHKVLRYKVALVSPFLDIMHVSAHVAELEEWQKPTAQIGLVANVLLCWWVKK